MLTLMLQQDAVAREQLKEQIRQTVKDAQLAAEQAAKAAADAKGQAHGIVIPPIPPIPPVPAITFPSTGTPMGPMLPPQVEPIAVSFFVMIAVIVVGLPLMRAIARRIDRGTRAPQQLPAEVKQQLQQLSSSIDAIAIEVERISEGQRFTTKLLSERQAQPATLAQGSQK
jgi:hypothetical protein